MIIKGLQKTSLVDWDGKVVSVLFCAGCNFKCGFCFNPDLVFNNPKISKISEQKIFKFLDSRKNFLDGVCITGGEPTLQKDLPEFILKIINYKLKIKLDTNGSNPEMLEYLIKNQLISYIAMDIKTSLDKYSQVTKSQNSNLKTQIKKSINLIINSKIDHEFRSTLVPGLHTEEDINKMAQLIKGARIYFLQNFRPQKTMDPAFQKIKPFTDLKKFAKMANKIIKTKTRS